MKTLNFKLKFLTFNFELLTIVGPIILVLFPGLVYLLTLPPSILWVDSGTMVAASKTLGIPNPPGFPLYMMASHIFTQIPFGSILFRMQIFTMIFAILTLVLVYKTILLILKSNFYFDSASNQNTPQNKALYLSALFGSLCLAFSYEFWSQSHNTDSFLFTYFFGTLILYLVLKIQTTKKAFFEAQKVNIDAFKNSLFWGFLLISAIFGLASGTNPTIALFIPSILFVLYLNRRFLSLKALFIQFVLFISIFLMLYSYLPLRAGQSFVNWNNPKNLSAILSQMSGSGLNIYAPQASIINGFTGSPLVFFQSLTHFFWSITAHFTPILIPFLVLGLRFVWKNNKKLATFLLLPILINALFVSLYFSGNQESWFIPSWIILSVFMGLGFYDLFNKLKQSFLQKGLFFVWLLPFLFWFPILDRSSMHVISDYAQNLYIPLEKNALLLGTGDLFGSLSYYMKVVDQRRQDITPVIVNQFYFNRWLRDNLRKENVVVSDQFESLIKGEDASKYNLAMNQFIADNIDSRPIYVLPFIIESSTFPGDARGRLALDERFEFMPHGLTQQVVKKGTGAMPNFQSFEFKFTTPNFPEKKPTFLEKTYNRILSDVVYQYGRSLQAAGDFWMFNKENPGNAYYWYQKSRDIQALNPELILRIGYYYSLQNQHYFARQYFSKAVNLSPNNPNYHYYLANSLLNLGQYEEASREAQILQELAPGSDIAQAVKEMLDKAYPTATESGKETK